VCVNLCVVCVWCAVWVCSMWFVWCGVCVCMYQCACEIVWFLSVVFGACVLFVCVCVVWDVCLYMWVWCVCVCVACVSE